MTNQCQCLFTGVGHVQRYIIAREGTTKDNELQTTNIDAQMNTKPVEDE